MKKILFPLLSTRSLVLGVTASIFLSSCSITNGAYTETDGIYYDPKTDVIPSNNYFENEDNRIDNIYNYEGQGLISNNKKNIIEAENRFRNTNNTQNKYSDWGGYACVCEKIDGSISRVCYDGPVYDTREIAL